MIVLCSSVEGVGKTFVIKSLCQMLKEKSLKMLYIDSVFEVTEDIKNNLINSYLYNYHVSESEIKVNNISENLDKVYFHLDDISYRHPLDKERLKSLIENYRKEYDYIVCELFVFKRNKQLFSTFTVVSDLTLLVSRFKVSNKFADRALLGFIRERNTRNIAGFMNDVVKHYYKYLA